jgi:EpsI family protein
MIRRRLATALTATLLLAAGVAAWAIRHEGAYAVVENRLPEFPARVLDYTGWDDRLEDSVYAVLGNDYNLLRRYSDGSGRIVWLYIGYYGTANGGRPSHVPQSCYTGQGFSIEDWRRVPAPGSREGGDIHQMVVKRQQERQLVLFWSQNQGYRIVSDGVEVNLLRLQSRLIGSRDDGSLVRLSMPIEPGRDQAAMQELSRFAAEVIRLLPTYWPVEAKVQAAR